MKLSNPKLFKPLRRPVIFCLACAVIVLVFLSSPIVSQTTKRTPSPITTVCLTKDSQLISGSDDGLQVHDLETLNPIQRIATEVEKHYSIVASPDGSKLAVAGGTPAEIGVVEVFSVPEMKLLKRFAGFDDIATDVAWLDEDRLVAASVTGNCCVFDLKPSSKENSPPLFNVHSKPILSITVLQNKEIISAGKDASIRVWKTGSPSKAGVLNNHIDIVNSVSVRPTQENQVHEMTASVSNDATIRLWQPSIGRMVRFKRLESKPTSVIWNRDGTTAIVGCEDGSILTIDPSNANQVVALKTDGWIYDMHLASDDSIFVAGEKGLSRVRLSK